MTDTSMVLVQGQPSQVVHPWRATLRTVVQAVIGLAALFPVLVGALGDVPDWLVPILAGVAVVAGAITRIAAIPAVNTGLTSIGVGAEPKPKLLPPVTEPPPVTPADPDQPAAGAPPPAP